MQENALGCQGWSDFSGMSKISSTNADQRFIWNAFLLEPFRKNRISERWLIEIVHGYISNLFVFYFTYIYYIILNLFAIIYNIVQILLYDEIEEFFNSFA